MMAGSVAKVLTNRAFWSGVLSIAGFLILWEIGARSRHWMAPEFFVPFKDLLVALGFKKDYLPWIGAVPAPSAVLKAWIGVLFQAGYWQSWQMSLLRVMGGFIGLAIAYPVTFIISKFLPATLSLTVVGIALGVSILTGVISGFLPAWRAANMNPVDALRSE